jgi:hypothetical protein
MADTFRALCAELLDELQALRLAVAYEVGCPSPEPPVVLRARAELAKPEPQGVSYRQLLAALESLIHKFDTEDCTTICELEPWKDLVSAAKDAQPEPEPPTDGELLEAFDGEFAEFFDSSDGFGTTAIPRSEWTKVARAVLARWSTPAIQPVPVSERLPGPEELATLVPLMHRGASLCHSEGFYEESDAIGRIADLLEQLMPQAGGPPMLDLSPAASAIATELEAS